MSFEQQRQTIQPSYQPDQASTRATWPGFPPIAQTFANSAPHALHAPLYPFPLTLNSPYDHLQPDFRFKSPFEGDTSRFSDPNSASSSQALIQAPSGIKLAQPYKITPSNPFAPADPSSSPAELLKPANSHRDLPLTSILVSSPPNPFTQLNTPNSATSTEDPTDEATMTSSVESTKSNLPASIHSLPGVTKGSIISGGGNLSEQSTPAPRIQGLKDAISSQSVPSSTSAPPIAHMASQSTIAERRPRRAKSSASRSVPKATEPKFHAATRIPVNMLPVLYNEILVKLTESGKENVDKYAIQSLVISIGLQNAKDDIPEDVNERYEQLLSECLGAIYSDTRSQYMNHGRRKNGRVELEGVGSAGDQEVVARYHTLMESTRYRVERLYRNSEAAARYVWTRGDFVRFKEAFRRFGYAPTANRQIAEYVGKGMHPNHIQYFKRALKQRLGGNIREIIESPGYDSLISAAPQDDGRELADFLPPEESAIPAGTKVLFGSTVGGTFFQSGAPSASSPSTLPPEPIQASKDTLTPTQTQSQRKRGRPPKNPSSAAPSAPIAASSGSNTKSLPLSSQPIQLNPSNESKPSPASKSAPSFPALLEANLPSLPPRESTGGKRIAMQLPSEALPPKRAQLSSEGYSTPLWHSNMPNNPRNEPIDLENKGTSHQGGKRISVYPTPPFQPPMSSAPSYSAHQSALPTESATWQPPNSSEEEDTKAVLSRLMKQTAELQAMVQKLSSNQQSESNFSRPELGLQREQSSGNLSSVESPYFASDQYRYQPQNTKRPAVSYQPQGSGTDSYQPPQHPNDGSPTFRPSVPHGSRNPGSMIQSTYTSHQPPQATAISPTGSSPSTQASLPTSPLSSSPTAISCNTSRHPSYQPHPLTIPPQLQYQTNGQAPNNRVLHAGPSNPLPQTYSTPVARQSVPSPRTGASHDQQAQLLSSQPANLQLSSPRPVGQIYPAHPTEMSIYGQMGAPGKGYYGHGPFGNSNSISFSDPSNLTVQYPFPFQTGSPSFIGSGMPASRPSTLTNQTRNLFGIDSSGLEEELLSMDDYPPKVAPPSHAKRNKRG